MNDLDTDVERQPIRGARLKHTASYISSPLTVVSEKVDREAGLADAARTFQKATQYPHTQCSQCVCRVSIST